MITKTKRSMPKCADENLGFGKVLTDHMLKVKWSHTHGWHTPEITPAAPIPLHPFSHVFHYAQEVSKKLKHVNLTEKMWMVLYILLTCCHSIGYLSSIDKVL